MELATCRKLVVVSVSCLVLYQVGAWVATITSGVMGVASAVLVLLVTLFSARMARAGTGNTAWFLVPTLLFTVLPLGAKMAGLFARDAQALDWIVAIGPFAIEFILPVALLMLVYLELRERTR